MTAHLETELKGEEVWLLPQKAMLRPAIGQLVIADLHLGKTTHFRRAGLPLPEAAQLKDIDMLHFLLNRWQPRTVMILGDLFHSDYNREWLLFKSFLLHYPATDFFLVEGNHDILGERHYRAANLLHASFIEEDSFIFSHHPLPDPPKLNICGHVHPGVQIGGFARQYEKLPCFFLRKNHFILPAFGHLTGLQIVEKNEGRCFLVTGSKVLGL